MIKRFFDILLCVIGAVIVSPILLIIAIWIKCSSEGPVFFKQERLGLYGKTFEIIKFRTMVVNAEHLGNGIYISEKDDPRITKIGKILRKTSLDELPQIFNIINGEMSLVGPRPPVTYHPYDGYSNYPEWAQKRFQMRPGITGLAQVTLPSDASWNERIVVDNKYVDKFSVLLDAKILLNTIVTVVKGDKF